MKRLALCLVLVVAVVGTVATGTTAAQVTESPDASATTVADADTDVVAGPPGGGGFDFSTDIVAGPPGGGGGDC